MKMRGGYGGGDRDRSGHLKKADEVAQHQAVDTGQSVHHGHGGIGALVVCDALFIELVRDQGLLQLPVPQLQQRRFGTGREGRSISMAWAAPDGRRWYVSLQGQKPSSKGQEDGQGEDRHYVLVTARDQGGHATWGQAQCGDGAYQGRGGLPGQWAPSTDPLAASEHSPHQYPQGP